MKNISHIKRPYYLFSALRGPDHHAQDDKLKYLKTEVTARLRAIVFDRGEVDFAVYNEIPMTAENFADLKRVVSDLMCQLPANKEEAYLIANCHEHFLIHLAFAIRETQEEPIWGGYGRPLAGLMLLFRGQMYLHTMLAKGPITSITGDQP